MAESKRVTDSLGQNNCKVILDTKQEINRYYLEKLNCPGLPFDDLKAVGGRNRLLAWLGRCRTNYIAFGCISSSLPENYPLILQKYPYLVMHKSYVGGDFYLFSKISPVKKLDEYFYAAVNTFEPSLPEWGFVKDSQCSDSLPIDGKKSFHALPGAEFSPTFYVPLRNLVHTENDVIDVAVDLRLPVVFPAAWLVVSITSGKKVIYWDSTPVSDYISPGGTGRVFHSLRLSDTDLRHHGLILKAFLWNPVKSPYVMDNFSVKLRTGNPVLYGIYRKISLY